MRSATGGTPPQDPDRGVQIALEDDIKFVDGLDGIPHPVVSWHDAPRI